jgi:hypothetical protein
VGGNSCGCITGYFWNSTTLSCQCDFSNNFFTINGICYDCGAISNSAGLATQSGCGCAIGFIWISSSGKCGCPSGFISMGTYCGNCSLITIPIGATVAGCQACSTSQGFFLYGGICYACSKQKYTSGAATSSGCVCSNSTLIWSSAFLSCVCNAYLAHLTRMIGGNLTCVKCSGLSCSCGLNGTNTLYINGFCV